MKKNNIVLSIIIPVRNEGVNLKLMIKVLSSTLEIPHQIIVVCDTKDDNSVPVIKKLEKQNQNIKLVFNTIGVGVTNAIKSGILNSDGEYILIFSADELGPVLAIEDMLTLMKDGCNLVSCTRYAYRGRRLGGSKIQALVSSFGNKVFNFIVGTTLTDSTTGIKMFRKDVFNEIELESKVGWSVLFELAIKAQLKNMQLGEVPIISIDRLYGGKSTFKLNLWLSEYLKWFVYGAINLRRKKNRKKVLVRIPQNIY